MVQNLNILTISILIISMCSCCKTQKEHIDNNQISPEWNVRIPIGTSSAIMTGNINPALIYNNIIVFPTTIRSYPNKEENRLCGINISSHKLQWIFPKDTTINYGLYFRNASAYQDKDIVIGKSCFNLFGEGDSESVLCFSLKNQEIIWQHQWPGDSFSNDIENNVYSDGKRCFSVINGHHVFAFNIRSGEKELIYDSKDYEINHGPIIIDSSHFGIMETKIGENEEDYRYTIINPISGEVLSRKQLPYDKKVRATICNVIVQNRTIYYTDAAHTAAIDALTGEILWTRTDEGFQCQEGLHLSNGILLKHNTETFMAFNSENGEELYSNSSFGFGESTLSGKYLYCNDCEGHIIILEYISGKILDTINYPKDNDEFRFGGSFSHFPIIKDNKLYLIGQNASNNKDYRVFCYPTYPWN